MTAKLTFYPLGNADTLAIDLRDGRRMLIDYANVRDPNDRFDLRCDLADELRTSLRKAGRDYYDVACFTHLDNDHCKGASEFFWLTPACYQGPGRIKIRELWVPAAAITEEGLEDDARVIRQEARERLIRGSGIRVFSRPERLRAWLASKNIPLETRAHLITDAGHYVPGLSASGPEGAEFFVHCPFGHRLNEREVEDRNEDSVVLQATFMEGGNPTYALLGSDVNHETLAHIVRVTLKHRNADRLLWDIMKLPHHCSYLSLGPERGVHETVAVPEVKWLFEVQGREGAFIVSPSKPIPAPGTKEDQDSQPPHRQAASHHRRVARLKNGEFKVTMETPSAARPKPFQFEITQWGASLVLAAPSVLVSATSTPARAG